MYHYSYLYIDSYKMCWGSCAFLKPRHVLLKSIETKLYYQISTILIVPYMYHYSYLYIDSYKLCWGSYAFLKPSLYYVVEVIVLSYLIIVLYRIHLYTC